MCGGEEGREEEKEEEIQTVRKSGSMVHVNSLFVLVASLKSCQ